MELIIWSTGFRFLNATEGPEVFSGDLQGDIPQYDNRSDVNSNVFLSAGGAAVVSILLITSWWKASLTVTDWVLLTFFSFALMTASIFDYSEEVLVENIDGSYASIQACEASSDIDCSRILLGQYMGLCNGIVALLMIPMTRAPALAHVVVSTISFVSWAVGVSRIAYGSGHGTHLGDAFLEVWVCVFLALDIATTNTAIYFKMKEHAGDAVASDDGADPSSKQDATSSGALPSAERHSHKKPELEAEAAPEVVDPEDSINMIPGSEEGPDTMKC